MILMDCLAGSAREMIAPSLDHRIEMPGSLDPSSTSENPYADCPLEHVRSEAWWYRNLFEGQGTSYYYITVLNLIICRAYELHKHGYRGYNYHIIQEGENSNGESGWERAGKLHGHYSTQIWFTIFYEVSDNQ